MKVTRTFLLKCEEDHPLLRELMANITKDGVVRAVCAGDVFEERDAALKQLAVFQEADEFQKECHQALMDLHADL